MSEVKLTPEQNEAIHSSGKNILVSASAGSGKTFVMAQRIVEKVKQGIEIDRLFISTFTKKAASELRMRLERDLKKARQESSDENQARRLTLALQNLSNADIGTMDSFTQKLTKTNFNRVNIDPNFRILADQTESDLIRQEVFEQLVESYLSEDDGLNISKEKFDGDNVYDIISDVVSENEWLASCIKKIDVTDIGKQHDLTMTVKELSEMLNEANQTDELDDLDDPDGDNSPKLKM